MKKLILLFIIINMFGLTHTLNAQSNNTNKNWNYSESNNQNRYHTPNSTQKTNQQNYNNDNFTKLYTNKNNSNPFFIETGISYIGYSVEGYRLSEPIPGGKLGMSISGGLYFNIFNLFYIKPIVSGLLSSQKAIQAKYTETTIWGTEVSSSIVDILHVSPLFNSGIIIGKTFSNKSIELFIGQNTSSYAVSSGFSSVYDETETSFTQSTPLTGLRLEYNAQNNINFGVELIKNNISFSPTDESTENWDVFQIFLSWFATYHL
mgnify:CR=1 FL=1